MENKQQLFNELLNSLNEKSEIEEYKYIGTGDPLSDILIIGKETAFEIDTDQYRIETLGNFNFWNKQQIANKENPTENGYNPRFPYKGQILKRDNRKGNNGTSVTWMNYQKLINYIYNTPLNKDINFHDDSFITEVNSTPSKKTANANSFSIGFRKENILNSKFFQSFKIVIISGVGYFNITKDKNEIEDIFQVKYIEKKNVDGKTSQPFWIHKNEDNTKLVINTYQLSIGISDNLLKEIAREIQESNILNI
ncbi:hypothetical protein MHL31_12995 [Lutibacter sp. A80]|uniref:hypothetical protein n=1 Tax=Lutibacter sp. A80 TaxID=2918453 RepID=UPI001F057D1D|nr:hypothetical protein [Lutibacter sp. A80]UMB59987.1 hypothetical protein MHL31_12995 [Lutibacter sp. A80]